MAFLQSTCLPSPLLWYILVVSSILKEKRLALGKELVEAAAITKVRESHLHAIEDEDYERLPIPVYTRGYIREYARLLDVDASLALEPYERFLSRRKKPESPDETRTTLGGMTGNDLNKTPQRQLLLSAEREIAVARTTSGSRSIKLSLVFFGILVVVGAAILYQIYGAFPSSSQSISPDVIVREPVMPKPAEMTRKNDEPPSGGTAAKPETQQQALGSGLSLPPLQNAVGASAQKPTSVAGAHVLVLTAVEKVWVQVITDRSEKKEMLLNPGDVQRLEGRETFRLWIGNAGGLKVAFDGKEIAHGGKSGQSLRLVLPEAVPVVPSAAQQPAKPQQSTERQSL